MIYAVWSEGAVPGHRVTRHRSPPRNWEHFGRRQDFGARDRISVRMGKSGMGPFCFPQFFFPFYSIFPFHLVLGLGIGKPESIMIQYQQAEWSEVCARLGCVGLRMFF